MGKRPTRDDVAREAGTSTAVVSYVINEGPRPVSEETKQKVLAAIHKTGYMPNGIAKSLANGSSDTYALLVTDMANPFLAQMAQALEHELFSRNKTLLVGDSNDDPARQLELLEAFQRQQVSGLVWYGVDQPLPLNAIDSYPGTVVLINQPAGSPAGQQAGRRIRVEVNEYAEAQMATEHLISHGYQHLAMISGPKERLNSRERIRGWKAALRQADMEAGALISAPYTRQGGYDAALQIGEETDAVFVSNELQAMGFLAGLAASGRRAPDDVAVVAMNRTPAASYLVPSLTAVQLPHAQMAKRIAEVLIGNIVDVEDGGNTVDTGSRHGAKPAGAGVRLEPGKNSDDLECIGVNHTLVIGHSCGCTGR
ncbi:LacI family transcriptional regulator [Bifidobacterium aemilianum]|uniref:LacI family transcriptional regulator n=1 Tax=Bifidobacterium aemilianum TaxID=2493120 RepID=A0A366K636_9BIFI|nr:LacI family DNA-binding transcriptional regulator [Bifidobacterium aemilianum]RBP97206.1 LacI family transcriptional regulator [Bifidobacterium aemilianum]